MSLRVSDETECALSLSERAAADRGAVVTAPPTVPLGITAAMS
jgi:hypothetical protein